MSTPDPARHPAGAPGAGTDWRRVEQLFHDARERPPDQRGAFLAQACDGDPALQHDVESLLAQEDGSLLRDGVPALARRMTRGSREGTRLGPYVLGPLIGEGGMGEVYRARDARLDREVAIKLLPADLAHDPDRLRRSEREARVLASLNHPNIAAIFGLEEGDGLTGLVLELVPGLTLQQHLATRGPLTSTRPWPSRGRSPARSKRPISTASCIGISSPRTSRSRPMASSRCSTSAWPGSKRPSRTARRCAAAVTGTGRILGTAAYMSPEQARGQSADRRTDIWAFGAVLFEMLTGQRVFQGESVADTVAAVIHGDPRLDRLPPSTPWYVRATIDRCLQKDARDRARDIADVRMALDGAFSGPAPTAAATRSRASARWLAAAALAGALLAGALVWVFRAPSPRIAPAMRFRVSAPEDLRFGRFALSPDGRSVAFTAASEAAAPACGCTRSKPVSHDTSNAPASSPCRCSGRPTRGSSGSWPGARSIALRSTEPRPSGLPRSRATAGPSGRPTAPSSTRRTRGGLLKVPASGGTPVAVTELDAARDETGHTNPVMLPDGRRFLYFRASRNPEQNAVFVGSLDAAPAAQPTRPVLPLRTPPLLSRSPDGAVHLLFVRDGTLMAQELDVVVDDAVGLGVRHRGARRRAGRAPRCRSRAAPSRFARPTRRRAACRPGSSATVAARAGLHDADAAGLCIRRSRLTGRGWRRPSVPVSGSIRSTGVRRFV